MIWIYIPVVLWNASFVAHPTMAIQILIANYERYVYLRCYSTNYFIKLKSVFVPFLNFYSFKRDWGHIWEVVSTTREREWRKICTADKIINLSKKNMMWVCLFKYIQQLLDYPCTYLIEITNYKYILWFKYRIHRKKQAIIQLNYKKLLLKVEYVEKEIRINWQDFLYHCINIISFYLTSWLIIMRNTVICGI